MLATRLLLFIQNVIAITSATFIPGKGCGVSQEIQSKTVIFSSMEPLRRNWPPDLQCGGVEVKDQRGNKWVTIPYPFETLPALANPKIIQFQKCK